MAIRKLQTEPPPFGKWLEQERKSQGFTQAELAQRAGYREKDIGRWENGKNLPRAETVVRLLKALGWDLPFSWYVNERPDLRVLTGAGKPRGRIERMTSHTSRRPAHGPNPTPAAPSDSG